MVGQSKTLFGARANGRKAVIMYQCLANSAPYAVIMYQCLANSAPYAVIMYQCLANSAPYAVIMYQCLADTAPYIPFVQLVAVAVPRRLEYLQLLQLLHGLPANQAKQIGCNEYMAFKETKKANSTNSN
jgi:predicted transposase YdaD